MHLFRETNQPSELVIDNEHEVPYMNDALRLAENVGPNLISQDGIYPKDLSCGDTTKILHVMDMSIKSELGTTEKALSKVPQARNMRDLRNESVARLAIYLMLNVDEATIDIMLKQRSAPNQS